MPRTCVILALAIFGIAAGAANLSADSSGKPPESSASATGGALASADSTGQSFMWFKGNLHTHTANSDGDSSPVTVAKWYRDHDYDFLVISDHNVLTDPAPLQRTIDKENKELGRKPFLLIPGEEVTDYLKEGKHTRPIHLGGVGTTHKIGRQGGKSVGEILQKCVDATHAADGLVHINHPNFGWALTADDLAAVKNVRHFEIFNGHPQVHNQGGSGHPSAEEMWDDLLGRGRLYYGMATDDAHHLKKWGPDSANPGRGWVVVKAAKLAPEAIVSAIDRGDFYASTGVELDNVTMKQGKLSLKIHQQSNFGYRTFFVGKSGVILAKDDESLEPSYSLKPDDMYVRARVVDSAGRMAWTQPLYREGALKAE